ncbi:hypothetical protein MSG28_012359 [Choristoneura fumiferana]|uniref:Uncharacterized protein n=1 Tax=Choristoneura fumiferana TaxID=7141 RepID=A0ACC0KDF1_CHOFU|nr:hypothetical protein MSG28_012359 [Choristoneura fumiferana]
MDEIKNMLRNMQEEMRQQKADMLDMKDDIKNTIINNINEKFQSLEIKNEFLEQKLEQQKKEIDKIERFTRRKTYYFSESKNEKDAIRTWRNIKATGEKRGKNQTYSSVVTYYGAENKNSKNKKNLGTSPYYIKEDFPPEVMNKRKELQIELEKEREQGRRAIIKYDRLIILKPPGKQEEREKKDSKKRNLSESPESPGNSGISGNSENKKQPTKINKSNNMTNFLIKKPTLTYREDPSPQQKSQESSQLDQNPSEIHNLSTKNENLYFIATFNVRTLSTHTRLLELLDALENTKFDIIGLSEIRRLGNTIEEHKDIIFHYIGETPGLYGVGFLVKKHLKNNIESFTGLSERVALLKLNIDGFQISFIQVYAPTEAAHDDEIEHFYNTIDKALSLSGEKVVVMGDFNAKIGQPTSEDSPFMNIFGYGERNSRGERLIQFAHEKNLYIMNTFFRKKSKQRWTWRSPDGVTKNELDYILTNLYKNVQDVQIINVTFPSDHRFLRATLNLKTIKKSRTNYAKNTRSSLKSEDETTRYLEALHICLEDLTHQCEDDTVQKYYDKIICAIENSLKTALIPNTNTDTKCNVISERTRRLIHRRKELQQTKPKSRALKNELKALYKLISKYIRQDYKKHRKNTIIKYLNSSGSLKRAYKELRSHKTWIEGLRGSDKVSYSRKDILQIATMFYKALYNAPVHHESSNVTEQDYNVTPTEPVDELEIIREIKRLKPEKSPGPDRITNETIKIACTLLATPLAKLFNMIIDTSTTPGSGDPKDINNYRPISLLPSLYKLFSSVIEKRISNTLDSYQPIEQAGFRRGYSTVDHIHSVELLLEKYQEFQRPLYVAFIDYQKAFDTILHSSIWEAMKTQNVEAKYIKVLKYLYENSTSRVKLETTGPPIEIKRGVRQGDPLSPKIFIAVLESIISKLNWSTVGLNINGERISHLRFADDLVLLSENSGELEYMIDTLQKASRQKGLEMNFSKTKVMTNSTRNQISIDNVPLDYVDSYIYLGKQISFQKQSNDVEIERRIKGTWKKYWSLKEIFKSQMPMKIKKQVMDSCLLPSLTYACQTWKFTRRVKNKITSCQRSMERSMMKIRKIQKIRHSVIREVSGVIDALSYSQKLKWRWAGHVARMGDNRWTSRLTSWPGPAGTRKRGRPKTRWADDIVEIAGKLWMEKANDRDYWASLEEAFTLN